MAIEKAGSIEDDLSLDIDKKLNAIPFLKPEPTILRVSGRSQYLRTDGVYSVSIKGTLFDQLSSSPVVTVAGHTLNASAVLPKPPYDLVLNIDTSLINKNFDDHRLSYVPVVIHQ